jgi:hypothetical protein
MDDGRTSHGDGTLHRVSPEKDESQTDARDHNVIAMCTDTKGIE